MARLSASFGLLLSGLLASLPAFSEVPPQKPQPKAPPAAQAKPAPKPGKATVAPPSKSAPKGAPKKGAPKKAPLTRKAGEPGAPDENARRVIAGLPQTPYRSVDESPELRALRELDMALFSAAPSAGSPWPSDEGPLLGEDGPVLLATGLPPEAPLPALLAKPPAEDLSWLRKLSLPDIPVRWDARVVRYLDFYKNTPRGRSMVANWVKKSGRYGASIRRVLREQGLPEDVVWLALVESGFDPTIHSPVGAAGLWQFMPEGARIYGLTVDRWIDERLDPERSTLAAARYLSDLNKRFGNWELAFAAYNMGYGGLLSAIRKYNTNDFWELSRLEAGLPLETALYVPKIVSMAIVAKNCAVFGCENVELDSAVTFDKVMVGPGVALKTVAQAAGVAPEEVSALNPQLPIDRTPPLGPEEKAGSTYIVRVPPGTGPRAAKSVSKLAQEDEKLMRVKVRWGETLDDLATEHRTTRGALLSLNGLRHGELLRPGTILLVPHSASPVSTTTLFSGTAGEKPAIVVPAETFSYSDRKRIFYRVAPGDSLREIAAAFAISGAELARWNGLDPSAALHDGMTLQMFVDKNQSLAHALVLEENEARILPVGSMEFFTHFENLKGRKRIELKAAEGDTWRSLSKRYGLSLGMLERINHRSRTSQLAVGEKVVVYVPQSSPTKGHAPARLDKDTDDKVDARVAVVHPVEDHPPPTEELALPKPDEAQPDEKDRAAASALTDATKALEDKPVGKAETAAEKSDSIEKQKKN